MPGVISYLEKINTASDILYVAVSLVIAFFFSPQYLSTRRTEKISSLEIAPRVSLGLVEIMCLLIGHLLTMLP